MRPADLELIEFAGFLFINTYTSMKIAMSCRKSVVCGVIATMI